MTWASGALPDEAPTDTSRWRGEAWSYGELRGAGEDLPARLEALRDEIQRLMCEGEEPWRGFTEAVAELRRVGHDLWRWDHGGDSELWGRDSMRAAPGQGLRLEVRYQPVLKVGLGFGEVSLDLAEED